jgi:cobalamin biosynthesis Mg chelatase CobN
MQVKKLSIMMVTAGIIMIIGMGIWLASAQPVRAQCGSQASSCKNCHETQGQMPVNNDGTAWHTQHAFGDFCYLCHGGNNQATDKVAAHTGMVAPLVDINTSCKSCHPADTLAKAQIYATTLGVQVGADTGSSSSGQPATTTATATPPSGTSTSAQGAFSPPADSANLVDYVKQYNQTANGKSPSNWGNIILIVMAVLLFLGGGGFIVLNEKLVRVRFKVSFGDTRIVPSGKTGEYPADVVDMLPAMSGLNPHARNSLKKILDKPEKTDKVLNLINEVVSDSETEE